VGIDHGGFHIAVAEEFLDSSNVIAGFEEVGRKTMAEGVATGMFVDASFANRVSDGFLEGAFAHVPTAHEACFFFQRQGCGGERILPAPGAVNVGVFAGQGRGFVPWRDR